MRIRELIKLLQNRELFGITRRKRLELCGLKRKWLVISSQIPYNSTKLLRKSLRSKGKDDFRLYYYIYYNIYNNIKIRRV